MMDHFQYIDILTSDLLSTLSDHNLDPANIYFQQDSNSKHRSGHTKGFLNLESIDFVPWTANSPSMNSVKNCWDHVDCMVHSRNPLPKNLDELWDALQDKWYHIDLAYINKLMTVCPIECVTCSRPRVSQPITSLW